MNIAVETTVCTATAVYELCSVQLLPAGHYCAPYYSAAEEQCPPVRVYDYHRTDSKASILLAYPAQSKGCAFSLGEYDSDGALVGQCIHTLGLGEEERRQNLLAKLRRTTDRAQSSKESALRAFPAFHAANGFAAISVYRAITSPSHIFLHGVVRFPLPASSALEFVCLNDSGNRIDSAFSLFGTTKTEMYSHKYADMRFSVRIPFNQGNIHLCAWSTISPGLSAIGTVSEADYTAMAEDAEVAAGNVEDGLAAYNQWLSGITATRAELEEQSARHFDCMPLFSIVVPLFKTPLGLFSEMLGSVLAQSYANWELLLVNASPEDEGLRGAVARACEADARVKCVELDGNHGISENTNAGIERASGDFVCFFDHDDLLEPNCLFEYARAVNEHPDADVLYCDEDKLMPNGLYTNPIFKPDFNLGLLRNNNYICHMLAIRKSLLDRLTPNTSEFDGAQDYNLTLQATEKARVVHHIQKILYHWRMTEQSTASGTDRKPYATVATVKALQSHFDRLGIPAKANPGRRPFTCVNDYQLPASKPTVSLILWSYDAQCVQAHPEAAKEIGGYPNLEILHACASCEVRAGSTIAEKGENPVVRPSSSLPSSLNEAAREARGEYLLFLREEVLPATNHAIEKLLGPFAQQGIAAIGCRILNADGTIRHAGLRLDTSDAITSYAAGMPTGKWGPLDYPDAERDVTASSSECLMVDSRTFKALGGFNADYRSAFFDADFCLRAWESGYRVLYTPEVEAMRIGMAAPRTEQAMVFKRSLRLADQARFMERWSAAIAEGDRFWRSFTPYLAR